MIYVIGGPTGSGKTALAVALAEAWHAPIINADAFQMYQEFNIGTNKDLPFISQYKPYLFDEVSPTDSLSVASYQQRFRTLIKTLLPKHPRIIMVGGTGLYMKASLYDFEFAPEQPSLDISKFEKYDNRQLHDYLATLDLPSSQKIHYQNRRRVLRAIAIHESTGKTKSEIERTQLKTLLFPTTFVGILPPREWLYAQLEKRVEKMFKEGLVEEVKFLVKKYGRHVLAFQAIGYKELIRYLDGEITLDDAIQLIKQSTKRYAKRQITYFQHQLPMRWYGNWQEAFEALTR